MPSITGSVILSNRWYLAFSDRRQGDVSSDPQIPVTPHQRGDIPSLFSHSSPSSLVFATRPEGKTSVAFLSSTSRIPSLFVLINSTRRGISGRCFPSFSYVWIQPFS